MSYEDQYNAAKAEGSLTNMTPKYVEFKQKGDALIGSFISRSEVESTTTKKNYYQYMFDTDFGLAKCHLGSATDNEAGQLFNVGGVYRIEFQGKQSLGGGKAVNKYNIDEIAPGREEELAL